MTTEPSTPLYADVILPHATGPMTFEVGPQWADRVVVGSRVIVQFGARKFYSGIVYRLHATRPDFKTIKPIEQVVDAAPVVTAEQLRLWEWISEYYMCTLGMVMRAALPSGLKLDGFSFDETLRSGYSAPRVECVALAPEIREEEQLNKLLDGLGRSHAKRRAILEYVEWVMGDADGAWVSGREFPAEWPLRPRGEMRASATVIKGLVEQGMFRTARVERSREELSGTMAPLPVLTEPQQRALGEIRDSFARKQVTLLHGVTGSGKTEIYIHLIASALAAGKNVLYLLPEIALTTQLIDRLAAYFGDAVCVYHSRLTDNRRASLYGTLLHAPGGRLLVGVRSSVLLPTPNLGLVVVDEEHETTFKQSDGAPRYHGRDTAVVLASLYGADALLGSATPSVESYFNAVSGKYGQVTLQERYSGVSLPQFLISDVRRAARRGEKFSHFNKLLLDRMEEALGRGEQVILFQNRRGFSPYIECGSCGWSVHCPDCNVSLTYHKVDASLRCHYCGYSRPVPRICPSCQSEDIQPRGFGTEKIEEELATVFPDAVIDRLDADSTRTASGYTRIISAFERGDTDILVGTQMVTKGFDFGSVTLVGVLNADNLLNVPDFRAGERAFQLMTQVGGRAGRRSAQGTVVVQTAQPDHPILGQVSRGDYEAMVRTQLAERQAFLYPPYCRLIAITLRHRDRELLWRAADRLGNEGRVVFGRRLLGPEPPPVDRIRGNHLARLMLKVEKQRSVVQAKKLLQELFDRLRSDRTFRSVEILVDVDPQ